MSLLFLFLDGVGLAPASADNPLTTAPTPHIQALLGGPLVADSAPRVTTRLCLQPIDATLGIAGLPQSGTGQTALFAGFNAAARHGRHQPHFPPVALRDELAAHSVFRRVQRQGGQVAFANAFGPVYWQAVASRRVRRSASVIAAEGAGVRFRDDHDLRRGTALAWDITGELWRDRPADWQPTSPTVAGQHLAALLHEHNLVLFECFLPDLAGHGRLGNAPQVEQIHMVFQRIDALLGGVLATLRPEDTLLISSDHGNVESLHAVTHTRNPVPLLAVGAQATAFRAVQAIDGIAAIVEQVAMR